MNSAEQDIRIIDLERRVTHLTQSLGAADRFSERLLRRIIMLTHRVRWLEGDTVNPMASDYDALAAEPEAVSQITDSRESARL